MMTEDDWWLENAAPLHQALDDTMQMPRDTPKEKRLAILVERCPWLLTDLTAAPEAADDADDEKGTAGPWTPVTSSNLDAFRVDPASLNEGETGTLDIRFKNGAEWRYSNVPGSTIADFIDAPSQGSWFAHNIKGKFGETRIK